jgi:hypothetical protein
MNPYRNSEQGKMKVHLFKKSQYSEQRKLIRKIENEKIPICLNIVIILFFKKSYKSEHVYINLICVKNYNSNIN